MASFAFVRRSFENIELGNGYAKVKEIMLLLLLLVFLQPLVVVQVVDPELLVLDGELDAVLDLVQANDGVLKKKIILTNQNCLY